MPRFLRLPVVLHMARAACLMLLFLGQVPVPVDAHAALLGVGSSSSSSSSGLGSIKGATFTLDTKDKKLSKFSGNTLGVDVQSFQVMTNGGVLEYLPDRIEFTKSMMRWSQTFREGLLSLFHNDRDVLHVIAPEGPTARQYYLRFKGNLGVEDVYINKDLERGLVYTLCIAEGTLNGDINHDYCDKQADGPPQANPTSGATSAPHRSLTQLLDTTARLLVKAATNMQFGGVSGVGAGSGSVATRDGPQGPALLIESLRLELVDELQKKLSDFKASQFDAEVKVLGSRLAKLAEVTNDRHTKIVNDIAAQDTQIADARKQAFEQSTAMAVNATWQQQMANVQSSLLAIVTTNAEEAAERYRTLAVDLQSTKAEIDSKWMAFEDGKDQKNGWQVVEEELRGLILNLSQRMDSTDRDWLLAVGNETIARSMALQTMQEALSATWSLNLTQLEDRWSDQLSTQLVTWADTALVRSNQSLADQIRMLEDRAEASRLTQDTHWSDQLTTLASKLEAQTQQVVNETVSRSATHLNETWSVRLETMADTQTAAYTAIVDAVNTSCHTTIKIAVDTLSSTTATAHVQLASSIESHAAYWNDSLANLNVSLINWNRTHGEFTANLQRQIGELTSNTSNAIGRSNSILAKAIGDVNGSVTAWANQSSQQLSLWRNDSLIALKTITESTQGAVDDLWNRSLAVHERLSREIIDKGEALIEVTGQWKDTLSEAIVEVNGTLVNGLEWMDNRLQMAQVISEASMDHLKNDLLAVNSTLHDQFTAYALKLATDELPKLQTDINASVESLVSDVSSRIDGVESRLQMWSNDSQAQWSQFESAVLQNITALSSTVQTVNVSLATEIYRLETWFSNQTQSLISDHTAQLGQLNTTWHDNLQGAITTLSETVFTPVIQNLTESTTKDLSELRGLLHEVGQDLQANLTIIKESFATSVHALNRSIQDDWGAELWGRLTDSVTQTVIVAETRIQEATHSEITRQVASLNDSWDAAWVTYAQQADEAMSGLEKKMVNQIHIVGTEVLPSAIAVLSTEVYSNVSALSALTGQSVKLLAEKVAALQLENQRDLQAVQTAWKDASELAERSMESRIGAAVDEVKSGALRSLETSVTAQVATVVASIDAMQSKYDLSLAEVNLQVTTNNQSSTEYLQALTTSLESKLATGLANGTAIGEATQAAVANINTTLSTKLDQLSARAIADQTTLVAAVTANLTTLNASMSSRLNMYNTELTFLLANQLANHTSEIAYALNSTATQCTEAHKQTTAELTKLETTVIATHSRSLNNLNTELAALAHQQNTTFGVVDALTRTTIPSMQDAVFSQAQRLTALETNQMNAKDVLSVVFAETVQQREIIKEQENERKKQLEEAWQTSVDMLTSRLAAVETQVLQEQTSSEILSSTTLPALTRQAEQVAKDLVAATNEQWRTQIDPIILTMQTEQTATDRKLAVLQEQVTQERSRCDSEFAGTTTAMADLKKDVFAKVSDLEAQLVSAKEAQASTSKALAVAEALLAAYERRLVQLEDDNARMKREMATQQSVDGLRSLLHDVQTSMVSHSGKVLDVLLANAASSKGPFKGENVLIG